MDLPLDKLLQQFPPIVSAAEMAAADAFTIGKRGIPGKQLMERAGQGVLRELLKRKPSLRKILVLCGKGNNGGDGFVVARRAIEAGLQVQTIVFAEIETLKGDAKLCYEKLSAAGAEIYRAEKCPEMLLDAECVVDALYGLQFHGALSGAEAEIVQKVCAERGRRSLFVVSVDLPSGILCDSGTIEGAAFESDLTVTFEAWKPLHLCFPGAASCGERVLVEIGIEFEQQPKAALLNETGIRELALDSLLISSSGHKGVRGHVAVIAGSPGHSGAAALTSRAALRSGAGLVTLVSDVQSCLIAVGVTPEIMTSAQLRLKNAAFDEILSGKKGALVVGPGLGDQMELFTDVLERAEESQFPLVIDATALSMLEGLKLPQKTILTPHPGELAGMLGCTVPEIQADRFLAVRRAAEKYCACVVLKGAYTLIGFPTGQVFVAPFAHANLGTAGSGDTLSGLLGGLLARGLPIEVAALTGVYLHGMVGSQILPQGIVGSLASEFADLFPEALVNLLSTSSERENVIPVSL